MLIIFCAVTTVTEESTITPSKSSDKGNLTIKLYFRDFKQPRRQWQQERQKTNRFNTQTQQLDSCIAPQSVLVLKVLRMLNRIR